MKSLAIQDNSGIYPNSNWRPLQNFKYVVKCTSIQSTLLLFHSLLVSQCSGPLSSLLSPWCDLLPNFLKRRDPANFCLYCQPLPNAWNLALKSELAYLLSF